MYPQIAKLWHPTKNGTRKPENFSAGSSKVIIHWICPRGHEWEGNISNQIKKNIPCIQCSKLVAKVDGSDLSTRYPKIAEQWHPEKNGELLSTMINAGSHDKAWWLGECGHEWEAPVENRTILSQGCPYCSSRRVLAGFNDLQTTDPVIADQWHPSMNDELMPTMVSRGSNKRVWWLGECGHEWDMVITSRVTKGQNCPYCSGARILIGFNDFASSKPDLLSEWDFGKNVSHPTEFSYGSKKKVWWKCHKDHSWIAPICDRSKYGCPGCAKENAGVTKSIPKNGSSLKDYNPTMAAEWHPTKNGDIKPSDVNGGSKFRAWWQCSKGHEWETKISERRFYKTGCPVCALNTSISRGHQAIADFLTSYGLTVQNNDRTVLGGKEIDIYLPEKKFGIEYNGLYWHSENAGKDNQYHYDKWNSAQQKGIQLIQIWEDEWLSNPELVKAMIAHKIGLSSQRKVFARKTYVSQLDKKDAENFLIDNHIQGYASGGYYYGLREKESNSLVSVLVLKKEQNNALNIIRYATSHNVVGGFTKLLSYVEKEIKPRMFITFSDNCVSDGGLYANNGFAIDRVIKPDYRYVIGDTRAHKFGYRLKRFREDPNLIWDENKTEKELAILNNLPRIWDAGKIRWVKILN